MPTYDANGNLTAMCSATYSYDARSLLVTADGPPEANPGPMTNILNITRDTRRRITCLQHNAQTTYRIYDNWNLIAEYAPSGTLLKEHIHGTRIDEILLTLPASGPGTYHHHDALGNVIALTNASGSVVERYRYDVFGHVTILDATHAPRAATAHNNRFLFTGREWLADVELYDYRNRSYCPMLGRFLQTDTIRFDAGDGNLYRYVFNSSPNFTDPEGLVIPFAVGAIVVGGITGGELALITWACMILQPCEEIYLKSPATLAGNFSGFLLGVVGVATTPSKSCFLVAHVRKDATHICHYDWVIRCI